MSDNTRWVRPLGTAAADGWQTAVVATGQDWQHTSLRVTTLAAGESRVLDAEDWEHLVVPLSGGAHVTAVTADARPHRAELTGRPDVFAGPTDTAYVPARSRITLRASSGPARIAVAGARVTGGTGPGSPGGHAFRHLAAAEVPVERRGSGSASRQVRNFGTPEVLAADAIIACEVITPAGNWGSWPPHKHDTARPGEESELEEIYYFETRPTDPRCTDPVGYQRVYTSDTGRPIDVLAEVRTGDVVLVPHGWHGPAMAAPDAHLYYLNVMAGPGPGRAWLISDDPAHAWVRETWPHLPFDARPTSRTPGGAA
ncbi:MULTISPECIES: 5-deoxy-glucuronate isomerase [unclassified Streptomyces]|uniref:5-deoxy-glucuronate isomerase n=1 Tax=unclassified Streptomyces TaxID=2593676 RepID=UPI0003616962|nr:MULTISPECIES: 5-deoxy-glucuronate isomerase [unclassified Streptomyces]MYY06977.1 5-deoxy-glucuronate isomerase [Streptomyces sp. SID4913]